jgi:hypothetical protein
MKLTGTNSSIGLIILICQCPFVKDEREVGSSSRMSAAEAAILRTGRRTIGDGQFGLAAQKRRKSPIPEKKGKSPNQLLKALNNALR